MTHLTPSYSPDHFVFSGGRYLKAVESLDDIDNAEYSILVYLGSLLNFKEGFIGKDVFPAIATIARSVKLAESTVRKKLRALAQKGYITISEFISLNTRGRWQQRSNNYQFTSLIFAQYEKVLQSKEQLNQIVRRVVGESTGYQQPPSATDTPSPTSGEAPDSPVTTTPHREPETNSLFDSPLKSPPEDPSSYRRDIFTMKREASEIKEAWEEVVGLDVSKLEEDRFFRQYIRLGNHQALYLDRIGQISEDPYLHSRAKSMMFLFKPFDMAIKNRREMQLVATKALRNATSSSELADIVGQLPELVSAKSFNFAQWSKPLADALFGDLIGKASRRLGAKKDAALPRNNDELATELLTRLKSATDPASKARLQTILEVSKHGSFQRALELYAKQFQGTSEGVVA